ncbi:hypothetical protein B0H16DRAFT_1528190 [Mycena metata]|uniref:Uncharacterized protein n=1 Tax=Mycena metata TaxID=1033252 RepID=A0AAD7NHY4_9AGAR|nr:hypothetical protein B0H16DRAFT_1528190 [Mycena metata]
MSSLSSPTMPSLARCQTPKLSDTVPKALPHRRQQFQHRSPQRRAWPPRDCSLRRSQRARRSQSCPLLLPPKDVQHVRERRAVTMVHFPMLARMPLWLMLAPPRAARRSVVRGQSCGEQLSKMSPTRTIVLPQSRRSPRYAPTPMTMSIGLLLPSGVKRTKQNSILSSFTACMSLSLPNPSLLAERSSALVLSLKSSEAAMGRYSNSRLALSPWAMHRSTGLTIGRRMHQHRVSNRFEWCYMQEQPWTTR